MMRRTHSIARLGGGLALLGALTLALALLAPAQAAPARQARQRYQAPPTLVRSPSRPAQARARAAAAARGTQPVALAAAGDGWTRVIAEDFEGAFPPAGWQLTNPRTPGGQFLWGKRDCRPHEGGASAWAVGGGTAGAPQQCGSTYPNGLLNFMKIGPLDLTGYADGELQFGLWSEIEGDGAQLVDKMQWGASLDGRLFNNYATAGFTGDWVPEWIGLNQVPYIGSVINRSGVYLGWSFESDVSNPQAYRGSFVDTAALWLYRPPAPAPDLPARHLPITRHSTLADFAGGSSSDGAVVALAQGDGALALADQPQALSSWQRLPSLPREMISFRAVAAKDTLFVIGGNTPDGYMRKVYRATIGGDGVLGYWQETTPLPQALLGFAAVVANDHLIVLGGYNNNGTQASAFSAPIDDNGRLGVWASQPELPLPLVDLAAVAAHGAVYALGGTVSDSPLVVSDAIYRASVGADGSLGAWQELPARLPEPSQWHGAVVACERLFVLGGADTTYERNAVYQAPIYPDGSIGVWSEATPLPKTLITHQALPARGGIVVVGGWHSGDQPIASQRGVYWAPFDQSCNLGSWQAQPPLPFGPAYAALAATDRFLYSLGGVNAANRAFASVHKAEFQLSDAQAAHGTFNHTFALGQPFMVRSLRWAAQGAGAPLRVRYRVGSPDGTSFGAWSPYASAGPLPINAFAGALEYELEFFAPGDWQVSELALTLGPNIYLPVAIN